MSEHAHLEPQILELLEQNAEYLPHFLLERFPHVVQRIINLWGKAALDHYLHGLLAPIKPGCVGFPKEALMEIASIKAYARYAANRLSETGLAAGLEACPRELFLALVDFDFSAYPSSLEAKHPELLQEISKLLDAPTFASFIDTLLSPGKQLEYGFSERILIELMTIKATNLARSTLISRSQVAGTPVDEQVHEVTKIIDRVHRW